MSVSFQCEPVFVKKGANSLWYMCQKTALETCRLELDEGMLLYPYNPCHYGFSLGGVNCPGMMLYIALYLYRVT